MANTAALIDAIKTLVDGAEDLKKSFAPGQTLLQRIEDFGNLIPDVVDNFKTVGDLGAEIKALQATDIEALAAALVSDLNLQDTKARAIADAAIAVLNSTVSGTVPDVITLIHAIEGTTPASPVPAA